MIRRSRLAAASVVIAVAVAVLATVVAGRSLVADPPPVTVVAAGPAGTTPQQDFPSSADHCYVDAMLPHHEQALTLSEIILAEPLAGDRVRALAAFIIADQGREIEAMREWREAWARAAATTTDAATAGTPAGHAGHGVAADPPAAASDSPPASASPAPAARVPGSCAAHGADHAAMRGMATDGQLDALRAGDGAAAERLFLDLMIAHHDGALEMARTAVLEGSNAFVRASAKHVLIEQDREIAAMRGMLEDLG